jgi:hypothetical protein
MNGTTTLLTQLTFITVTTERFPEQYPAVVDEWADPIESDNAEMAALRPMLKNTNMEFRGLRLTYSANRDGWNAPAFHKKVDKQGGGMGSGLIRKTMEHIRRLNVVNAISFCSCTGLVVCTTSDGLVCGGYNPKGEKIAAFEDHMLAC